MDPPRCVARDCTAPAVAGDLLCRDHRDQADRPPCCTQAGGRCPQHEQVARARHGRTPRGRLL